MHYDSKLNRCRRERNTVRGNRGSFIRCAGRSDARSPTASIGGFLGRLFRRPSRQGLRASPRGQHARYNLYMERQPVLYRATSDMIADYMGISGSLWEWSWEATGDDDEGDFWAQGQTPDGTWWTVKEA